MYDLSNHQGDKHAINGLIVYKNNYPCTIHDEIYIRIDALFGNVILEHYWVNINFGK